MTRDPEKDPGAGRGFARGKPARGAQEAADAALLEAAREARSRAYAPYSRFRVGAALRSASGRVYLGCNVENASYGLTLCAERVALFAALGENVRAFEAMAIAVPDGQDGVPCGICRQVLAEFAPGVRLILGNADGTFRVCSVHELLPGWGDERQNGPRRR